MFQILANLADPASQRTTVLTAAETNMPVACIMRLIEMARLNRIGETHRASTFFFDLPIQLSR